MKMNSCYMFADDGDEAKVSFTGVDTWTVKLEMGTISVFFKDEAALDRFLAGAKKVSA